MSASANDRAARNRQTSSSARTATPGEADSMSSITIRNSTILIVGDESRSLLGNLSDGRFERFALISASPETAWELFQHATIALVLFKYSQLGDLWLGRAMKERRPWVPILVLADNWTALEGLSFADVLLSARADSRVLRRHVQAQHDATRERAA